MSGHIHAELMAQYAEDARETICPWERWECRRGNKEWQGMFSIPSWNPDYQYRRKPRTITINGREVPEPMRQAPKVGDTFYSAVIFSNGLSYEFRWAGSATDRRILSRGLAHATEEAAIAHAEALLSFTATGVVSDRAPAPTGNHMEVPLAVWSIDPKYAAKEEQKQ